MNNKNFTTPKLCSYNNDLSKSWYVYFYYTDSETAIKKQFRYKMGINRFKTVKERKTEAQGVISALLYKLESDWSPFTNKIENKFRKITIIEALDEVLSLKQFSVKKISYKLYYFRIKLFKDWLLSNKYNLMFADNFSPEMAQKFFNYLLKERNLCGKSFNNYLILLRVFFTEMQKCKMIKNNPLSEIATVRQDAGKNTTYSDFEQNILEKAMSENNKGFFYATRFVKYGFMRRSELLGLQVKHINWENKTIIIPSETSKPRVQDSVTIPKSLENIILEMNILKLDPEMYVFSRNFKPNYKQITSPNLFTTTQTNFNRKFSIKPECTFYSWKHTGAVELYNLVKDPYIVMRQCRHTNIQTTMIYLRSLGCGVNEKVREW